MSVPELTQADHQQPVPHQRYHYTNVPPTEWDMERQPQTRAITFGQLSKEIGAIYSGATRAENLCRDKIAACNKAGAPLTDEQWRNLVGLHKATIYEFSDFFFAAQHPAAARSKSIQESRMKLSMPQRLWQRVQGLLDLMRRHLPASKEHMSGFISLSFTLFTVLYEHVTDLEAIWSECLGDVARFGMAVQVSVEERAIWVGASRMWYQRAIDLNPGVGRLSHHLAILARPAPMGQLFYFTKSLCATTPFRAASESITTLFNPVFSQIDPGKGLNILAVKLHGMVMLDHGGEEFEAALTEYMFALSESIATDPGSWESLGCQLAAVNVSSLLSYCSQTNPLARALGVGITPEKTKAFGFEASGVSATNAFERALAINLVTIRTMLRYEDVTPLLPYLHVLLAFLHSVSKLPSHEVPARALTVWPWETLSTALRGIGVSRSPPDAEFSSREYPPLPEDYAMRGFVWARGYLPESWFEGDMRDPDERVVEGQLPAGWMATERAGRCSWLEGRLAEAVAGRAGGCS